MGEQTRAEAGASIGAAAGTNGDLEAELRRVSEITGVPISTARANPDAVKRRAAVSTVTDAVQRFPSTMQFLADGENARIAHDDTDMLTGIESALGKSASYLVGAGKRGLATDVLGGAYFAGGAGAAGAFRAASEFIAPPLDFLERFPSAGGNPLRRLAEGFSLLANDSNARLKAMSPATGDFIGDAVSSGAQALGQNLMMMPMALLPGGQTAALVGMSGQAGGQSYQRAREKGTGQNTALGYGLSDAAIEFATEGIPVHAMFGTVRVIQ
jgi:hypothetical protein